MIMRAKIDGALRVIDTALAEFKHPAIMCSFGKDSMVVLHLVQKVRPDLPVIFHREPFQPHKYAFANKVILEMGLRVYDYPASGTAVQEGGGELEIVSRYMVGRDHCIVPTGIRPPVEGEPLVCGLADIYHKPLGAFRYPWDLVFHGHKSCDVDPVMGVVGLAADFARNVDSVSACFPIRHFTDEEVWAYTEKHKLPIHHERYEKIGQVWREREDKHHNPDYINACTACMRSDGPRAVPCPKLDGHMVANVWNQLAKAEKPSLNYIKEN